MKTTEHPVIMFVYNLVSQIAASETAGLEQVILGNNKYQLENMKLADVPGGADCVFISSPVFIEGAPETETRVYCVLK